MDHNHTRQHFKLTGRLQTFGHRFGPVLGRAILSHLKHHRAAGTDGKSDSKRRCRGSENSEHDSVGPLELELNFSGSSCSDS